MKKKEKFILVGCLTINSETHIIVVCEDYTNFIYCYKKPDIRIISSHGEWCDILSKFNTKIKGYSCDDFISILMDGELIRKYYIPQDKQKLIIDGRLLVDFSL